MSTIREIIRKLEQLPQAIETGFFKALRGQTTLLEERNQDALDVGERDDQSQIRPKYRPYTKKIKAQKGQPFDRVTLKDTGQFYRAIRYKVEGNMLKVFSLDPKFTPLDNKYSLSGAKESKKGNILGISPDTKNELLRFTPLLKFTLLESKRILG